MLRLNGERILVLLKLLLVCVLSYVPISLGVCIAMGATGVVSSFLQLVYKSGVYVHRGIGGYCLARVTYSATTKLHLGRRLT